MNKKDEELFQAAADALVSPRKCVVRWRDSAEGTSNGTVSKDWNGNWVIDISEYLSAETTYKTFLHELGHILDDNHAIIPSDYYKLSPDTHIRSYGESAERRRNKEVMLRELRANSIAEYLDRVASEWCSDFTNWNETVLHAKLKALAHARVKGK